MATLATVVEGSLPGMLRGWRLALDLISQHPFPDDAPAGWEGKCGRRSRAKWHSTFTTASDANSGVKRPFATVALQSRTICRERTLWTGCLTCAHVSLERLTY